MPALGVALRHPHELLGGDAEVPEVAEEVREGAEGVRRGRDPPGEHDRRIERDDVDVEHRPGDALLVDGGVAAGDARGSGGGGDGTPVPKVLAEQKGVDLGRVSSQDGGLIVKRQELRLREVGRREQVGDRQGLGRVVEGVAHEALGIGGPEARDVGRVDVGPIGRGDAEVPRDVLEAERRKVARPEVVELREDPGIDDVAASYLVAPVADRALRDLQAGRVAAEGLAPTTPGERRAVLARAGLQVLEVEPEDVVPLDHVGVPLPDQARALLEQGGLGEPVAPEDLAEARRVGERDRDDPVGRTRRVGKLEALGGQDLDVEREPAQGVEPEPEEGRPPGEQQVLVHGVVEEAERRVGRPPAAARPLAAVIARAARLCPPGGSGTPAERAGPVERRHLDVALEPREQIGIGQEQERREAYGLADRRLRVPAVDADQVVSLQLEGEEGGGGVGPDQQGVVVEVEARRSGGRSHSLSRPSLPSPYGIRRARSGRPAGERR